MRENWSLYHPEIPAFLRRLADTPPMRRLRQVGMNCGCEYTAFPRFAGWAPYSRFDHSLGVALIVWHFTGDLRQSAAGLLHDVATPAFAHVVDFLHGDHLRQESTEGRTAELIDRSPELQALLGEYGLTTEDVADCHRYPIADNDSPRLSADRLEYTLGDLRCYGFADGDTVRASVDAWRRWSPWRKSTTWAKAGVATSWSSPAALCRMSPVKCQTISATPRLWSNRE